MANESTKKSAHQGFFEYWLWFRVPSVVDHTDRTGSDWIAYLVAPSSSFTRAAGAAKAPDSLWAVEPPLGAPLIHDSLALGLLFLLP